MILAQRKQLGFLIRLEFCNHENGSCIALEDGDTHTRPQTNFFSVSCKWFRWAVLPLAGTPEAEILGGVGTSAALLSAGKPISLNSTMQNVAQSAPP